MDVAEAARAASAMPMEPSQEVEHKREVTALRGQLDEADFAQTWAAGWAMTLDQAVQYALSEQESKGRCE